jgi:hypothetical protein
MSRGDVTILSDENLQEIYTWVDNVPLTRAKRNITRDFSDGVLMAEVLHHYFPKVVDIKNYSAANSVRQKLYNWQTLNNKVRGRPSPAAAGAGPSAARQPPLSLGCTPLSSLPPPPPAPVGLPQAALPH